MWCSGSAVGRSVLLIVSFWFFHERFLFVGLPGTFILNLLGIEERNHFCTGSGRRHGRLLLLLDCCCWYPSVTGARAWFVVT